MTTNKKLVVTVCVMAVALILALTGIIVVLVTANQRASSAVNVKYTASDVAVTLSATAYLGGNTHQFTKGGVVGGDTELELSPTVTEGSLSQTSDIASFDLTKTNKYVVFEYVFANNTDNIDVKIDQDGVPATRENINLTYTYSDAKITNFATLEDNAEFTAQLLPAYTGEETVKYVYIKAEIADLLYDSSLVGDFGWALSKPQDSEVNTVTLSVANADLVERNGSNLSNTSVTSDYTYKTLETTVDTEDISIVPAEINKYFVGWSETSGGTVISAINVASDNAHNPLRGTTAATTLYPIYKDGNVNMTTTTTGATVTGLTDSTSTEAIIPDITTHEGSVVKVTSIGEEAFYDCTGLTSVTISNNVTDIQGRVFWGSGLTSITIPSSVNSIGSAVFYECTGLTSIIIPSSVTSMEDYVFWNCTGLTSVIISSSIISILYATFSGCTGLTSIIIPASVTSIEAEAFSGCTGLTSIIIPASVTSIEDESAFSGCTGLTSIIVDSGNKEYDSRNSCNAIIKTSTNTLIYGCKNTIIPNGVTSIGWYAFSGCTGLTSITISDSVTSIGPYAFEGCTGLLSSNGGSGIIFEDTSGWRCVILEIDIDVTDPINNALNLVEKDWRHDEILKQ